VRVLLIALQLMAAGADGYYTNSILSQPNMREVDPIARTFVQTPGARARYFATTAGVQIGLEMKLWKRHRKLAEALAIGGIADNTAGAAWSAVHR
jgi:hypothetical protein